MQWACWFSGQIVVPLGCKQPAAQLQYYLTDSKATCILTDTEHEPLLRPLATSLGRPLICIDHGCLTAAAVGHPTTIADEIALIGGDSNAVDSVFLEGAQTNEFYGRSAAMILYTSGSTGPPKGTVLSHRNLNAQSDSLRHAWQLNADDVLLHTLPLNHVHGCVNALQLPLGCGAKVLAHRRFDSAAVWSALLNVQLPSKDAVSVYMAVPTIYAMLIAEYDKTFAGNARMVEFIRQQCVERIRLMVSGSAPLPATTFQRWRQISGHKLLERYGMTEIGMALSNPLREDRVRRRTAGRVGVPLPGAEVKLVRSEDGRMVGYRMGEAGKGWWNEMGDLPVYDEATTTVDADGGGELLLLIL